MYSLGFANWWEVPFDFFFVRPAFPCILHVYCEGLDFVFLLIYYSIYLSKKKIDVIDVKKINI